MNSYLEIELNPNPYGGGSFYCKADFKLDNLKTPFQNIDVKIDTGCAISTIPVKRLKISENICNQLKALDIDNSVEYVRSYGIETGGLFHPEPVTKKEKMDCEALKFRHSVTDFLLDGVTISAKNIFLNYNRSGNILIGVDILKTMAGLWDISKKTGKLTLLCCPRNLINDNFYNAMKEHFGLGKI